MPGFYFQRETRTPNSECYTVIEEATPVDANVDPIASCSRQELIAEELCTILEEISGVPRDELNVDASFIEMGFDSLFLTRANTEFKKGPLYFTPSRIRV